jgi:ribosomal protein S18 acetylase RimI-like enzyme
MPERNKTSKINYRYLSNLDFAALHKTFVEAFSDYFVPFQLSEKQLENHVAQNSVELNLSVGAFTEKEMVGFTLNGFGAWNGKQTAYDAGTGVVPKFRGKGLGKGMFEFMLPKLREINVEQILLEVITENKNAIRLYRNIGFEETRKFGYFEQEKASVFDAKNENCREIREITNPDWHLLKTFWDENTSWQNSVEAVCRSLSPKIILGAYFGDKCVGYAIFNQSSGITEQLAVDRSYRRRGVASEILPAIQSRLEKEKKIRVSNVDYALGNVFEFLKNRGFNKTLSQLEMIKVL